MKRLKLKKIAYGLGSRPLESINDVVTMEGTLDYIDPEYVDTEGVGDPKDAGGVLSTEPTISPNKKRESEILKIIANYNIGPAPLVKRANLDLISLSANLGSRVAFNIITRARGFEFGSDDFVNFPEANITAAITDLTAKYQDVLVDASLSSTDAKARDLFDNQVIPAFGNQTSANFANPHILLYCYKKVEESKGGNIFSCDRSNYIMSEIMNIKTALSEDIKNFEDFLLANETTLLAVAGGGAVTQQMLLARLPRNVIAKLLRLIPGVQGPKDILKLLIGFKTLNESYEFALENDMCQNFEKYSVKNGVIQADVQNALYLVQKSIVGNMRNLIRGFGGLVKDVKDAISLGAKDFSEMIAPSAGRLDHRVVDNMDQTLLEEISNFPLSDGSTKFYTFDSNVMDRSNSQIVNNIFEGSIPNIFSMEINKDSLNFGFFDQTNLGPSLKHVISKLIADNSNLSYDVDEFYGTSVGMVDNIVGGEVWCAPDAQVTVKGVFKSEVRAMTEYTGDGANNDYSAVLGMGMIDLSGARISQNLFGKIIILSDQSSSVILMGSVIYQDGDNIVFKEIAALDEDLGEVDSLKKVVDGSVFRHDIKVLVGAIEKSGIASNNIPSVVSSEFVADFPDAVRTCVKSIDYATAYTALNYYADKNNIISERRRNRKVRRLQKKEGSLAKDSRRAFFNQIKNR